jgi:chromosome segregation ATPase
VVNDKLEKLENTVDDAVNRLHGLTAENARLRSELASASERMQLAGAKLRALAEHLPQSARSQ